MAVTVSMGISAAPWEQRMGELVLVVGGAHKGRRGRIVEPGPAAFGTVVVRLDDDEMGPLRLIDPGDLTLLPDIEPACPSCGSDPDVDCACNGRNA